MKVKILLSLLALLAFFATPKAWATDNFVSVTFKPHIDAKFIEVLNAMFGTSTYEKTDKFTYRLKVPKLKTSQEYAELFTSLSYVEKTNPAPKFNPADGVDPKAYSVSPSQGSQPAGGFVPGEILVKFKPHATAEDIQFINSHHGLAVLGVISGINVHRLKLPAGLSVEEAVKTYNESGLVEYAEPNQQMSIPKPPSTNQVGVITEVPLHGGGQVRIEFKPGTADLIPQLFNIVFETRLVEKQGFHAFRLQLPAHMNPNTAVRIFKLSPYVIHAERLYS